MKKLLLLAFVAPLFALSQERSQGPQKDSIRCPERSYLSRPELTGRCGGINKFHGITYDPGIKSGVWAVSVGIKFGNNN